MKILPNRSIQISYISILFLIQSCTTVEFTEHFSPYQHFQKLSHAIESENFSAAISMFSQTAREELDVDDPDLSMYTESFLSSVSKLVYLEKGNFSSFKDEVFCLTIYGEDQKNQPTSLDFEIIKENGSWKFSKIGMSYLQSEDYYPKSAKCPVIP